MAKKWLNNIGRIIRKFEEDGVTIKSHFIVFERQKDKEGKRYGDNPFPLTINEGDTFQLKPKAEDLAGLVAKGLMSKELAEKICNNVRFEISKGPDKEDAAPAAPATQSTTPTPPVKKNNGGVEF